MLVHRDYSLRTYNTFGVDMRANFFVSVQSITDIQSLLQQPWYQTHQNYILGAGSNVLFIDDYFPGVIIHNAIKGKTCIHQTEEHVRIRVGAGESWPDFVSWTVQQGRGGVENLALIPGTVGAAPVQNIGAYGVQIQDVVVSVEYVDLSDGSVHVLDVQQCKFGYRDSIFKHDLRGKVCITAIVCRLSKPGYHRLCVDYPDIQAEIQRRNLDPHTLTIADVADMVTSIRRTKLPDWTKLGTAGSFFKNPLVDSDTFRTLQKDFPQLRGYPAGGRIKLAAGQLIELAGYKGVRRGCVGTYPNHALVIVHYGGAQGKDIADFAQEIQDKVQQMFDIYLEPEVVYIGDNFA